MANNQQTINKIASNAAFAFRENAMLINMFDDLYSSNFGGGTTENARIRRTMFSSASGDGIDSTSTDNGQDEGSISLQANFTKHQKVPITEAEAKYSIEDLTRQFVNPMMRQLSGEAELFAHQYLSRNAGGKVGTAGTAPTNVNILNDVAERLDLYHIPTDKRMVCLNPSMKRAILPDLQQKEVDSVLPQALRDGKIGNIGGLKVYNHSINYNHTTGNYGGTPLVNGGNNTTSWTNARDSYTSSIVTDGWSANATLKAGDIITIAGVNAVHPQTKDDLGVLQQFTLTADATADGSGNMTVTVTPPVITSANTGNSGNYYTVATGPADNAAITVQSGAAATTFKHSIAFHPEAVAFASLPLARPEVKGSAIDFSTQSLEDGSLPVAVQKWFDHDTNTSYLKATVRFALAIRDPRAIVQILG